ncbi:MAG: hypothetical protein MUO97_00460 [Dehalococcoidia bacterium]|nr:hypothetical protein [Dehalococcoidia bacterium]
MPRYIKLGEFFGIPVRLHYTWLPALVLIVIALAQQFHGFYPLWLNIIHGIVASFLFLATEHTEATEVSASNVLSTNLSCKTSFVESFVIVHKVNAVDLRQFCRCLPKQICKVRIGLDIGKLGRR